MWHQWQRQADKGTGKVAAGEHAWPVVMAVHDGSVDASAGAVAGIGCGTLSTASKAGAGEP
jgi:hypothetical protein